MSSSELNLKVLGLKRRIAAKFDSDNWQEIALLTDSYDIINYHGRLLRSLRFGDSDYGEHVADVLLEIIKKDSGNLVKIDAYLNDIDKDGSEFISATSSERRITFSPSVFSVPDLPQRNDLVAVMMPFNGFDKVHATIKLACLDVNLSCLRADDIWSESTIIQDIFNLIFQAKVVVCDLSLRNANVFYETGIAHALGKIVVPISQSFDDIPSDLKHHRALVYHPNTEGLQTMRTELAKRFRSIIQCA